MSYIISFGHSFVGLTRKCSIHFFFFCQLFLFFFKYHVNIVHYKRMKQVLSIKEQHLKFQHLNPVVIKFIMLLVRNSMAQIEVMLKKEQNFEGGKKKIY